MKIKLRYFLPLIIFLIALISIDSWSLWCDESTTAFLAASKNFLELRLNLFKFGSETQMPGWILFIWFWAKIFGISEFALRSSNLFFIGLLLLYYLYIQIRPEIEKKDKNILAISLLLSIVNPFISYNLNEARSNIAVYCLSFISILALNLYFKYNSKRDWIIFCLSILLGFVFNMLVLFLIPVCIFILFKSGKKIILFVKENAISLLILFAFSSIIVTYYLFTLSLNKGGAIEAPGIGNIGYVFYDFLGFTGLGPDKNSLRESLNKSSLLIQFLPQLSTLLVYYVLLIVFLFKDRKKKIYLNIYFQSFLIGISIFFIVAFFIKFRFWSRHLLFIYPIFILFLSEVVYSFYISTKRIENLIPIIGLLILSLSSYNIVFNSNYKKENISEAISKTKILRNKNEKVIFTDAWTLAWYYNLDNYMTLTNKDQKGLLVWLSRNNVFNNQKYIYQEIMTNNDSFKVLYENKDYRIIRIK